jgi:hypothetical protein
MYVLNQQNWPYAVKKQNPGGGKKIHLKKVLTAFIKEKTVFFVVRARARRRRFSESQISGSVPSSSLS